MKAVVQAPPPLPTLNLAKLSPVPKPDTAVTVTVTRVLGNLVLVSCPDQRVGALDLEDTRNRELRARAIKVGDALETFIVMEDKSGNLLLSVKSPDLNDPWLQRHQVGAQIEGVVAKKTDEFIKVKVDASTSGRIYKRHLPPEVDFAQLCAALRNNQRIKCTVLAVHSRQKKKLILTLAQERRS